MPSKVTPDPVSQYNISYMNGAMRRAYTLP